MISLTNTIPLCSYLKLFNSPHHLPSFLERPSRSSLISHQLPLLFPRNQDFPPTLPTSRLCFCVFPSTCSLFPPPEMPFPSPLALLGDATYPSRSSQMSSLPLWCLPHCVHFWLGIHVSLLLYSFRIVITSH